MDAGDEPLVDSMHTATKLSWVVLGLGIFFYHLTDDLRWIYGAISGAAVPPLIRLI